jgi:hypothetical protein
MYSFSEGTIKSKRGKTVGPTVQVQDPQIPLSGALSTKMQTRFGKTDFVA